MPPDRPGPLYRTLADELRRKVAGGTWAVGDALPAETDLARAAGVSTGTLRRALSILEREGLIDRRQGLGTFVAGPGTAPACAEFPLLRAPTGAPLPLELRNQTVLRSRPPRRMGTSLPTVWCIERLIAAQNAPAMLERIYLDPAINVSPGSEDPPLQIYAWIARRTGVVARHADMSLAPCPAPANVAWALDCAPGAAVLAGHRIVRDGLQRLIDVRRLWIRQGPWHVQTKEAGKERW